MFLEALGDVNALKMLIKYEVALGSYHEIENNCMVVVHDTFKAVEDLKCDLKN